MAKQKVDGVVEAVHYGDDGNIQWIRMFKKRGIVFSDSVIVSRQDLVQSLEDGKIIFSGRRIPLLGSVFEMDKQLRLKEVNSHKIVITEDYSNTHDHLNGVPIL